MTSTRSVWLLIITISQCFITGVVLQNCKEPMGVPNAHMITNAPYSQGRLVTFRCYSGFTMTGKPSQTCGKGGQWMGSQPTCIAIDMSDTINQTVNLPNTKLPFIMPQWAVILVCVVAGVILLLLILLTVAAMCSLLKGCKNRGSRVVPDITVDRNLKYNNRVITVSPQSSRDNPPTRIVNMSQDMLDSRHKDMRVWMPHRHPIRTMNTNTK